MAEEIREEENPFDALAAIIKPASSYEDAYKRVWTAMKSGTLPEEKVIKILLSACAMPAICAANIKMEKILRDHGLIVESPQDEAAPETDKGPEEAPRDSSTHTPHDSGTHTHTPHGSGAHILQFPGKGPAVS